MNPNRVESEFLTIKEEEFLLSGRALVELVRDVLSKNTCFRLKVKGFSMSPFIRDNDVVTISPLRNSSTNFGKAVAFLNPQTDKLVIHRIIGKTNGFYFIKGDSIFAADGLIPKGNVLGCVTKVERKGKNIFFGLGWERLVIALFSKIKIWHVSSRFWKILPSSIRNIIRFVI